MTDEGDGNGGESRGTTPAHVSPALCSAYRGHVETKIGNMEKNIMNTVKLVGAVSAILISIVQLAITLYFLR